MDRGSPLSLRGCLLFLVISLIGVFLCVIVVYAGAEYACERDAKRWLVDYPGSQLVEEEYSWLRPFGIGRTVRTLYTTDARVDVSRWYTEHSIELDQEGKSLEDSYPTMRWRLTNVPDDGGTSIQLFSECALDLVLW